MALPLSTSTLLSVFSLSLSPSKTPTSSPPPLSGIGKSLAKKLLSQGANVVLVALDDDLLAATAKELAAEFPSREVRAVGVDLGAPAGGVPSNERGYLSKISQATADIDVQLVFLNAGYMLTGFFEATPLEAQLANLECNAVSAVSVAHLSLQRMVAAKLPG